MLTRRQFLVRSGALAGALALPATPADGATSLRKLIDIGPGGAFGTIDVVQSDTVVWKNNDRQAHWPVPNCTGLRVAKPLRTSTA